MILSPLFFHFLTSAVLGLQPSCSKPETKRTNCAECQVLPVECNYEGLQGLLCGNQATGVIWVHTFRYWQILPAIILLLSFPEKRVLTTWKMIWPFCTAGVNDSVEHAKELAELLNEWGRGHHVNLIPFNPIEGSEYRRPYNKAVCYPISSCWVHDCKLRHVWLWFVLLLLFLMVKGRLPYVACIARAANELSWAVHEQLSLQLSWSSRAYSLCKQVDF